MRAGMRFRWFGQGDPDFQWGDLVAFIETLPRSSALAREVLGEDAEWGTQEHLLAMVVDQLAIFRHAFAKKGTPPPRLITQSLQESSAAPHAPVDEDSAAEEVDLNDWNSSGHVGGEVWSTAETAKALGWA